MESCRAKIKRANELTWELAPKISSFLNSRPELVRFESRQDTEHGILQAVVLPGQATIPEDLSIRAGEVVHQLRSSLDHLVSALVIENGGEPNRHHQFPIVDSSAKFENTLRGGCLNTVSQSAIDRIEAAQPYHSQEPETSHFAIVQALDNMDKHRILIPMGSAVSQGRSGLFNGSDGPITTTSHRVVGWVGPTPEGAVTVEYRYTPANATGLELHLMYDQQIVLNMHGLKTTPAIRSLHQLGDSIQRFTWGFRREFKTQH